MGLLSQLEQRSRIESPKVPISSANIVEAVGLGEASVTGISVSSTKALGITAFWCGVGTIAGTWASLPCEVFERQQPMGRRPAREHPLHTLLHDRPNPRMSAFQFKEMKALHLLTQGNFYAEIERDGSGMPIALWPLMPEATTPLLHNGEKVYRTETSDGRVMLRSDQVLHIPGMGFDGLVGYNPIALHRESLGLTIAANEYGARFFGNSGRPSGYITHPGKPGVDERTHLREEWNAVHTGLSNAQRTAVLWGGMEWKPVSLPPEDAQFLQTREMQIEEVARILRITPILLQHHSKATSWGTGIEQFMIGYLTHTVAPWLKRDENITNWELFVAAERGRYYAEHNQSAALQPDSKARAEVLEIWRRNGIISADEWRDLENMNPLPDRQGGIYVVPLNMVPASQMIPDETATDDVQQMALNGTQISSLLMILDQVTAQQIAPDTAKAAIQVSFPTLTPEQIDQMVDSAAAFQRAPAAPDARQLQLRAVRAAGSPRLRQISAHKPLFEDGARRFVRRDVEAAERAIAQAWKSSDPLAALNRWITEFYPGQQQAIYRIMLPIVSTLAEVVAMDAAEEVGAAITAEQIGQFSAGYTETLAMREAGSSIGQLRALMVEHPPEKIQEMLQVRLSEWTETRPGKVAMNETVRVSSGATRYSWQQAGVGAIWRANPDACPICQEMDGRRVGANDYFLKNGDGVGDLVADHNLVGPPLHQGCACFLVPG